MAIKELARLAAKAESETARVAAIKELLDRGYGKAMQPIQGTVEYGISEQLSELFKENAGNTLGQEIARRAALLTWLRASASCNGLLDGQRVLEAQPATNGPAPRLLESEPTPGGQDHRASGRHHQLREAKSESPATENDVLARGAPGFLNAPRRCFGRSGV